MFYSRSDPEPAFLICVYRYKYKSHNHINTRYCWRQSHFCYILYLDRSKIYDIYSDLFQPNGNQILFQEMNDVALTTHSFFFQILPWFHSHFLPGDTIWCTSGGITCNKEKSVILQDFICCRLFSCFFLPFCLSLLLLLFYNNSFFFWRLLMLFAVSISNVIPLSISLRIRSSYPSHAFRQFYRSLHIQFGEQVFEQSQTDFCKYHSFQQHPAFSDFQGKTSNTFCMFYQLLHFSVFVLSFYSFCHSSASMIPYLPSFSCAIRSTFIVQNAYLFCKKYFLYINKTVYVVLAFHLALSSHVDT